MFLLLKNHSKIANLKYLKTLISASSRATHVLFTLTKLFTYSDHIFSFSAKVDYLLLNYSYVKKK